MCNDLPYLSLTAEQVGTILIVERRLREMEADHAADMLKWAFPLFFCARPDGEQGASLERLPLA